MSTITSPSAGTGDADTRADVENVDSERSYRYPGSPPFRDLDIDRRLFKGRDDEAKKVFHSILSSDVFLLYAVSGMGKSSLLNAGVMHRLRARGYWPVSVRLNETKLSPVQSIDRQIAEADVRDTEVEVLRTPGLDFDITADTTLWDLLGSLEVWRDDRLQHLVLVLDQFEELFTLDWNEDVRNRFIEQFGEVVRGHRLVDDVEASDGRAVPVPNVKFCIVIREDALGELEALADDVPQIMQSRFRLGALEAAQAESAIREPAMVNDGLLDTQPFRYSEEAAQHILDFLQETERTTTSGIAEENMAHSVDPSQLQIICQFVERRVLPGKGPPPAGEVVTIEAVDLGGAEGLRSVLGDFYRRTIGTFPPAAQRSVRHLCEDGLISKSGRRLSLEREEIDAQYGVSAAALHQLVDQRLLRVEPRVGSEYYELSHDTLVKPILADRSLRRKATSRRHRRFAFIAVGAVALLGLGFLTYRLGFDEGTDSVASLEFERPTSGKVKNAGDVERFKVVGRAEPSLILVEPSQGDGLDANVVLTNASKVERGQDQLGREFAERMVVPASPGGQLEVTVGSKDASIGEFEITQAPIDVTELTATDQVGEPIRGSIDEQGLLAVYSVNVTDVPSAQGVESSIEIVVASPQQDDLSNKPGKKPDPGLDVELEVIDPSGVGTSVDLKAAGDGERTTVGAAVGQYLVVVRDHGTGTGPFEISATKLTYTTLTADEPANGKITSTDVTAAFAIDVPATGSVELTVEPNAGFDPALAGFDPALEIVDPRGVPSSVDSSGEGGAEVALLTGEGRHIVRVNGYNGSTGTFTITTSTPVDVPELVEGSPVKATEPTAFTIVATGDQVVAVRVDGDLDPFLELDDSQGQVSYFDSSGPGETEIAPLSSEGQYVLRVSLNEGGDGSFEVETATVNRRDLAEGEPVTVPSPAVFDVDVASGKLLSFTADTDDTDGVLGIQVIGPDGFPVDKVDALPVPGDPVTAILDGNVPGSYQIIVDSSVALSDITANLLTLEAQRVVENKPVTTAAPAVFSVDVAENQLVTFTAQPASANSSLAITVNDADGFATGSAVSPSAGESATVSFGVDSTGPFQIIVTSSGGLTDLTATLQSVEAQQILGSGAVTANVAPAIYDLDLVGGERRLVIVTPQDDGGVFMEISSPGRELSTVSSPGPDAPIVALLSGEGRHRVVVRSGGAGGESFIIETEPVGGGP